VIRNSGVGVAVAVGVGAVWGEFPLEACEFEGSMEAFPAVEVQALSKKIKIISKESFFIFTAGIQGGIVSKFTDPVRVLRIINQL
jgi:hypothetical protein